MIRWTRGKVAAAALTVAVLVGLLAWQALTGHDAAVIGCQALAMATVAYGPFLIWRHRHPKDDDRDRRGADSRER